VNFIKIKAFLHFCFYYFHIQVIIKSNDEVSHLQMNAF